MPSCRDCGKDDLAWQPTKSGGWILVEVRTVPHKAVCPKRPAKAARPEVEALRALGYKVKEAEEMLRDARGKTPDERVKDALRRKG